MLIHVPSPLRSYTGNSSPVSAVGNSLKAVLEDLNRQYPGIRFRMIDEQDGIRPHIKLFVDKQPTEDLDISINDTSVVHIVCALSGG